LASAAEVTLDVNANRNRIYVGESIVLTVKVNGMTQPPEPDLSGIADCRVKLLGSRRESWSKTTIINGKVSRTAFSGRIFTYELTPASPGAFKAGPVILRLERRRIAAPGPAIDVAGIDEQDTVIVTLTSSRESVLVDEPFDIELSVAIKRLPKPYETTDPIDRRDPPTITAPYLDGAPIDGLETPDVVGVLRQLLVNRSDTAGFAVNEYTTRRDPFDFDRMFDTDDFMGKKKAVFRFEHRSVEIDGESYFQYRLTLRYVPKKEGDYTFGPALFKGKAVRAADTADRVAAERLFAVGPACTVRVIPPPEEGRPPTYIGGIGTNFIMDAALDTQTCSVGDPLTLTLTISGDVSIGNVRAPDLSLQTNLLRHFRTYEEPIQTVTREKAKEYQYTVRPTTAGTIELPPIEIAYYDTRERGYRTVRTRPIPLRANEAIEVSYEIVIDASTNRTGIATAARDDIVVAPLDPDPRGVKTMRIAIKEWQAFTCGLGPIAFLLVITAQRVRRRISETATERARRAAAGQAVSGVHRAEKTAERDTVAARRILYDTLTGYLGTRFDARASSMTPSDAVQILGATGTEPDLVDTFRDILSRSFNSGYARDDDGGPGVREDCRSALDLLHRIEKPQSAQRPSRKFTLPLAVIFVFLVASGISAAPSAHHAFLWDEANSRMAAAGTGNEFLAAARTYAELVKAGARNGRVFYNLGTALLQAGRHEEALAALLRAERYAGADEDIRRNMLVAIAAIEDTDEPSLPWYRLLLSWHYDIPGPTRVTVAVFAFAATWLAMILGVVGARRPSRALLAVSLTLLVLFGSSALASLHQEANAPTAFEIPAETILEKGSHE